VRFADIEVGKEYGLRLRLAAGAPLLHVLVLDKVELEERRDIRFHEHAHGEPATAGCHEGTG
jgi:hypothetical protein